MQSVHPRHVDIGEDQVWTYARSEQMQRVFAGVGEVHDIGARSCLAAKALAKEQSDIRLIIDHQDADNRFTVSLMMQPVVMARMLGACGGATRNMGFMARNLVAWPTSKIGQRPYKEPSDAMPKTERLNSRLRALLAEVLPIQGPKGALQPPALTLSCVAKAEWTSFFDSVEAELSRAGEFGDIPDIGSKTAENAARLAGVFHVIEQGPAGDLEKNLMDGAIAVAIWHLNEARRVMDANRKPGDVADAALLLEWLQKQERAIDPRDILRLGPSQIRDKRRRDAAIEVLVDRHWVFESSNPARLILNPKARISS